METAILEAYIQKNQSPLLKAQEICKRAVFSVAMEMESLLDDLKDRGMINNVQLKVDDYNHGYLLRVTFKDVCWHEYDKYPEVVQMFVGSPCNNQIDIQPGPFFNDEIAEGKGKATIEGRNLITAKDQKERFHTQINTNSVDQVLVESINFIAVNVTRIKEIKAALKNLS